MKEFRGIPVSSGVVIGKAFLLDDAKLRIPRRKVGKAGVEREHARLRAAIDAAMQELGKLRDLAEHELGEEAAGIFAFHQGMLRDPSLVNPTLERIARERVTAEYALQEQCREIAERFAKMPDPTFRTKVDDVWDLERRVLRHLIGGHRSELADLDHEAVVISPDLTPSQTAAFPRDRVLAFVTDLGGPTSHNAIFARALRIPAVVGVGKLCENIEEGQTIIVDGDRGDIIVQPDEATLELYRNAMQRAETFALSLAELRDLPAQTKDGTTIHLTGNIEFGEESGVVREHGGEGVGLFRTEFLWLVRDGEPSEDEQYEDYRRCIELAGGSPVTIRTFDLGADKHTQERERNPERNPFLGCRSIRYCLQNLPMFKRQLRAILRASTAGPTRIMFPLISNLMELRQAKLVLSDVREELTEQGIPFDEGIEVGMMVEVPAAALMAASFAKEVDFFSIGTNDLVQYALAVDRTNERVANLYAVGHPAVLKLIKDVVRAGRRHGVDVSCCGEAAGDPLYTMLLVGLGLRTLSSAPSRIPLLKRVIRGVDIGQCERLARAVGSFDSERRVNGYLREHVSRIFPELVDGRAVDGSIR